jgi:hypothetical protein
MLGEDGKERNEKIAGKAGFIIIEAENGGLAVESSVL